MTELEPDYDRNKASGEGTETAYTVEARYSFSQPVVISGQIFDSRWRDVHFEKGPIGVPSRETFRGEAKRLGMLTYAAAQALRWWLHAEAESAHSGVCLETRLIKHKLKYTYEAVAVSQHDIVSGEDRSNCMPDWGAMLYKPKGEPETFRAGGHNQGVTT